MAIRLSPKEKEAAASTFARSFFEYPMMTFYWPDSKRRERHLERYLGCAINYGLRYGQVYTTTNIEGIAIWLPPGQTKITNWGYIMAGYLPYPLLMGLKQYFTQNIKNEELVMRAHTEIMSEPHWYLWAIAVDPEKQGQGIGSRLMQPGIESADTQQLPCYVETHDESNISFYRKHGFELVRRDQIPDSDLRFWCFVRQPSRK